MISLKDVQIAVCCLLLATVTQAQRTDAALKDSIWRPAIHFAPGKGWINDPNGMVFHQGIYHLFFQHYPDGNQWGPMHWGHATSKDMVHWEEQNIKLFPDSLGYIFSGSAVVDKANTSGFGTKDNPPLVAVFTHHNPKTEKTSNTFQVQSLAYSLDNGHTWTKYKGNPVLKNPGIADFRDPKVFWHEASQKWIMALAVKDRIHFYASQDLRAWTLESEFGAQQGAHGGVWECPDLFPLQLDGQTHWVLLVNLNPGGPNGGSATQYFVGSFDGKKFTTTQRDIRWADYGPDEYAGVTFSSTGEKVYFIGWMSNWDYANDLPSNKWRNAMTLTRELSLTNDGREIRLRSLPIRSYHQYALPGKSIHYNPTDTQTVILSEEAPGKAFQLSWTADAGDDFSCSFLNDQQELIKVGYDAVDKTFYVNRQEAGHTGAARNFNRSIRAPRFSSKPQIPMRVIVDASSLEIFADNGLTVMTTIFFPSTRMDRFRLSGKTKQSFQGLKWDFFR